VAGYTIKDILNIEVAPSLGCTEPSAVGLCTASARTLLGGEKLDSMELWLSSNIFKNAYAVAIPGTGGEVGIDLAAALGYICGDPALKLQVLEPANPKAIKDGKRLISEGRVKINLLKEKGGIYVKARLISGQNISEAVIEKTHDNLVSLRLNHQEVAESPLITDSAAGHDSLQKLEGFLRSRSLEELVVLVENMDDDDYDFIRRGVDYNLQLSSHGLAFGCGLGVGKTLEFLCREGLIEKDMILQSRIMTSAACDARMSGAKLPAMSSAGSGNHGLTAVLPVWAVKDYLKGIDEKVVLKAIGLSHVITGYIKSHTGRLSAVCGCSVAAGAGAASGVTWLMGGNLNHIAGAIKNLISDLAGVICDGAKGSCALKLSTAAGTAVQSALFSLHGVNVKESDGIIALSPEQTMKNIGEISTEGMIETDRTILRIMIDKQFDGVA